MLGSDVISKITIFYSTCTIKKNCSTKFCTIVIKEYVFNSSGFSSNCPTINSIIINEFSVKYCVFYAFKEIDSGTIGCFVVDEVAVKFNVLWGLSVVYCSAMFGGSVVDEITCKYAIA